MKEEQRIKVLEDEIKVLKSEIKTVLLDIREQYLNTQNPFNQTFVAAGATMADINPPPAQPKAADDEDDDIPLEIEERESDDYSDPEEIQYEEIQTYIQEPVPSPAPQYIVNMPNYEQHSPQAAGFQSVPQSNTGTSPGSTAEHGPAETKVPSNLSTGSPDRENSVSEVSIANLPSDSSRNHVPKHESDLSDEFDITSMPHSMKHQFDHEFETKGSKVDLVVIAGLTQWIEQSAAKLGKERAEILLEMAFAMGRVPEKIKNALIKMLRISAYDAPTQTATASEYLSTLAQLDNLLANSSQQDNALLSILSMMKDAKHG